MCSTQHDDFIVQISKNRKSFINATEKVYSAIANLLSQWEDLTEADSNKAAEEYPFKSSLDEVLADFGFWIERITRDLNPNFHNFYPTVTVRELRQLLDELPGDKQIVVEKDNGADWLNIRTVEFPDNDGMFTLTLHTTNDFSPIQLGV